jgi:hypothetical protein
LPSESLKASQFQFKADVHRRCFSKLKIWKTSVCPAL